MAKERDYLISPKTTSLMFILSAVGMVAALVGLLLLASARPQGKFVNVDKSLHNQLVQSAEERLNNFHKNEDGSVAIPIDLAMDIVAEQGFEDLLANANTGSSQSNTSANAEVSGSDVYSANCASCHQATGAGIPGAFPPLAANAIKHAKNNREYLAASVINGLSGQIEVDGQSYNGAMPAWKHLSDNEIAAVINHITSNWDDATGLEPYTSEEIAAVRAKSLNNSDILNLRAQKSTASTASPTTETNENPAPISTASDAASSDTATDTPETTTVISTATDTASSDNTTDTTKTATAISTTTETTGSETTSDSAAQTTTAISTSSDTVASSNANGEAVYSANCVACHQATGAGIPGAFPPLAGNAINHAKNNRDYLAAAVISGLMGEIEVNGSSFNGAMPAWKQLSDSDIADVLNHIISNWDDASGVQPYSPDEVAAQRAKNLSFSDVLELRSAAPADSSIPAATTSTAATTETTATVAAFDWQEIGETTYDANCSSCHQATGNGIPGAFPPLNKNAGNLYNSSRDYLALTVLTGISGQIEVDGQSYNGAMPAWKHLSDEQIAGVLNYLLSSWDNPSIVKDFKAYTPDEIKEYRSKGLSAEEVLSLRP